MAKDKKKILKGIGWSLISLILVAAVVFVVRGQIILSPSIEPDYDMDSAEKVVEVLQVGQNACTTAFTVATPAEPTLVCSAKKAWKNEAGNTATDYDLVEQITTVEPGQTFVYELVYTSSDLSSITVSDELDSNLSFVDSASGCTYSSAQSTVSCTADTSVAVSGSVLFRVKVDDGLSETTTIPNSATLENTAESLSDSCSVSVTYTYTPPTGGAEISCRAKKIYEDDTRNTSGFYYLESELLSTGSVDVGDEIVYNVAVANDGDQAASDVLITDTLPSSVTYVDSDSECSHDASTGIVSCDLGALAVGGEDSSSIRVTVASSGSISNTANISSTNGQTDTCSITIDADGSTTPTPSPTPTPTPATSSTPTPTTSASSAPSELPEAGIMTFTTGTIGAGVLLLLLGVLGLLVL